MLWSFPSIKWWALLAVYVSFIVIPKYNRRYATNVIKTYEMFRSTGWIFGRELWKERDKRCGPCMRKFLGPREHMCVSTLMYGFPPKKKAITEGEVLEGEVWEQKRRKEQMCATERDYMHAEWQKKWRDDKARSICVTILYNWVMLLLLWRLQGRREKRGHNQWENKRMLVGVAYSSEEYSPTMHRGGTKRRWFCTYTHTHQYPANKSVLAIFPCFPLHPTTPRFFSLVLFFPLIRSCLIHLPWSPMINGKQERLTHNMSQVWKWCACFNVNYALK